MTPDGLLIEKPTIIVEGWRRNDMILGHFTTRIPEKLNQAASGSFTYSNHCG
jgi:hypothetical protein